MTEPPRYSRQSDASVHITERDIRIIRDVAQHRFLRATHIQYLTGASYRPLSRRLRLLYDTGYLDRPIVQQRRYYPHGTEPMVYALGNKGADLLTELDATMRARVDWTDKNHTVKQVFVEHTLLVADIMVAYEIACRERENLRFVNRKQLLRHAPEKTRNASEPYQWLVEFQRSGKPPMSLGVCPDGVFAIDFLDENKRAHFFLEADRATMPIASTDPTRSSIAKKLLCYSLTANQNVCESRFGFRSFRVLFATKSAERAGHMCMEAERRIPAPERGRFLFAASPALLDTAILSAPWRNGTSAMVRIVE